MKTILKTLLRPFWLLLRPLLARVFALLFVRIPGAIRSARLRNLLYDAHQGSGRLLVADGSDGTRFVIDPADQVISKEIFVSGGFDREKLAQVTAWLAQHRVLTAGATTLYDIGANIGTVCIPAVSSGTFARAVAVEADSHNARLLRTNVNLNGLEQRITVVEKAVSDTDGGQLLFERSADNFGDHRVASAQAGGLFAEATREKFAVNCTTLDTLIPASSTGHLIWMDIQGHEGQALAGAGRVLAQRPPLVIEFWPYGLARNGGLERFRQALLPYGEFIDINSGTWQRRPLAELDALWAALGTDGDFSDLLLY